MRNINLIRTFVLLFVLAQATVIFAGDQIHCAGKLRLPTDASNGNLDPLSETSDHVNAMMSEAADQREVGQEESRRFELFRFEKDYHPKNVLHYGMKINLPSCTINKKENGAPSFSNYWTMGEERGQTKLMTSDDLKRLGPIVLSQDDNHVVFKMPAFKTVPLNKKEIVIESKIVDGNCKVTGTIELNDGRKIVMNKIFAKMSTFIGIPTGVDKLTVTGVDATTGAAVSQDFTP